MAFDIRRVGPGDAALLARVATDVFDEPVVPERLAAFLAAGGHHLFVAVEDSVVVGQAQAVVHRHPDKRDGLYIEEVGVAPAHWRRGIGRALMQAVLALGRELGCDEVWLGTEPDNVAARALYESFGPKAEAFVGYTFGNPDKP
jgi:aminoglycoside 6'-N-acetyltransferase I